MKFLICGGGTGGHVSPAIAIYEALKRECPDCEISFVGRDGGAENRAYKATGERLYTLDLCGISRSSIRKAAHGIISALRARESAREIIKAVKPSVIIGTGGYVAWPMLSVGAKMGIPTVIHESNAVPGLTTRIISKSADRVLLSSEEAATALSKKENVRVVGNPLRDEFFKVDRRSSRRRMGLRESDVMILSFGGSLGAKRLNEAAIDVMRSFSAKEPNVKHLHATGVANFKNLDSLTIAELNGKNGCKILPYIDGMPTVMSAADVIISRCGAMTLAEISAVGVASILIPSPNVAENHQAKNAERMSSQGAAITLEESELTADSLLKCVSELVSSEGKRRSMSAAAKRLCQSDASRVIAEEILSLVK